jgi:hypothetical protein
MEENKEDFMTKYWRPMMAMTYMATCLFDFIVGPILYNVLQYYNPGQNLDMWQPLTLQGGGLYHIAMGVVLGISAHGRTQEKINTPSLPGMGSFMPAPQESPAPTPVYAPAPVYVPPAPAPAPVYVPPAPAPAPVVEEAPAPVRKRPIAKPIPKSDEPI